MNNDERNRLERLDEIEAELMAAGLDAASGALDPRPGATVTARAVAEWTETGLGNAPTKNATPRSRYYRNPAE
jgi:hypothetical protein